MQLLPVADLIWVLSTIATRHGMYVVYNVVCMGTCMICDMFIVQDM